MEAGRVRDSGNIEEDEYFLTILQPKASIQHFWYNDNDIIGKFLRLHGTKWRHFGKGAELKSLDVVSIDSILA